VGHPGLCVAVDPEESKRVWWWEPGGSGCDSRSTGPEVFVKDNATVVARPDRRIVDVHFRLQLIVGPGSQSPGFREVRLLLRDDRMEVVGSNLSVPTVRRHDLVLPESTARR
jgi:hypothetical protein